MAKGELTPKQDLFVREYLVDLNATQAAIRAGYSARTAHVQAQQLLAKTYISEAVASAQAERAKRVEIDQDWVLRRLQLVSDRCVQATPVLDGEGKPTGEYRFDAAGANRSTELIGKHLGMFVDRTEHSGPNSGPIPIQVKVDLL